MIGDSIISEIEARAVECGLEWDDISPFLCWIGNEVAEGREVADFVVLRERTPELVKIFKAQKAMKGD